MTVTVPRDLDRPLSGRTGRDTIDHSGTPEVGSTVAPMTFAVAADAYDRFMGDWAALLSEPFLGDVPLAHGDRVLDVGAGTGALTALLVDRQGASAVTAIDPSAPFVAALRSRLPGVDVREAVAASLPFPDGTFGVAVAQLVVHFMPDPVAGLVEMARVCRPGGTVACSTWDFGGGRAPLSTFWRAVREVDSGAADESELPGVREGDLRALMTEAGLTDVRDGAITVSRPLPGPEAWWSVYALGVGPAGSWFAEADPALREAVRLRCLDLLPAEGGSMSATAWTASGTVSARA